MEARFRKGRDALRSHGTRMFPFLVLLPSQSQTLPKSTTMAKLGGKRLRQDVDGELLVTPEEASDVMEEARAEVALRDPDHLYVPGRVLMVFEKGEGAGFGCVVGDGAATMMRHIEMDRSMVMEHLCESYRASLKGVLGYTHEKV